MGAAVSAPTLHERNPILYAPREHADCLRCRTCRHCVVLLASEFPDGVLTRDAGLCGCDAMSYVDPDEPRTGEDAECWEPRGI